MDRQTDTERGDNDAGNWLVAWLHHFPQPGMLLLLECMVTTSALAHNPSACPTLATNNIVVFWRYISLVGMAKGASFKKNAESFIRFWWFFWFHTSKVCCYLKLIDFPIKTLIFLCRMKSTRFWVWGIQKVKVCYGSWPPNHNVLLLTTS